MVLLVSIKNFDVSILSNEFSTDNSCRVAIYSMATKVMYDRTTFYNLPSLRVIYTKLPMQ